MPRHHRFACLITLGLGLIVGCAPRYAYYEVDHVHRAHPPGHAYGHHKRHVTVVEAAPTEVIVVKTKRKKPKKR